MSRDAAGFLKTLPHKGVKRPAGQLSHKSIVCWDLGDYDPHLVIMEAVKGGSGRRHVRYKIAESPFNIFATSYAVSRRAILCTSALVRLGGGALAGDGAGVVCDGC